ncbi:MAG: hypothetical protein LBQ92_05925, partial [Propionibacteriaceae bacterium]|nr:hypothetical protein [Propionibacteriaceae bacterium]
MFTVFLIIMDVLVIFSLAFVPYVTRKTELFGVSVPSEQIDIPELMALKRRYRNVMLGLGALLIAGTCVFGANADFTTPSSVFVLVGAMLGYVVAAFIAYLPCHFAMKRVKAAKGWANTP